MLGGLPGGKIGTLHQQGASFTSKAFPPPPVLEGKSGAWQALPPPPTGKFGASEALEWSERGENSELGKIGLLQL